MSKMKKIAITVLSLSAVAYTYPAYAMDSISINIGLDDIQKKNKDTFSNASLPLLYECLGNNDVDLNNKYALEDVES